MFKEEILWERSNKDIEAVKEFSARFIMENLFGKSAGITLDFVECNNDDLILRLCGVYDL
jgi:hypothetical protein